MLKYIKQIYLSLSLALKCLKSLVLTSDHISWTDIPKNNGLSQWSSLEKLKQSGSAWINSYAIFYTFMQIYLQRKWKDAVHEDVSIKDLEFLWGLMLQCLSDMREMINEKRDRKQQVNSVFPVHPGMALYKHSQWSDLCKHQSEGIKPIIWRPPIVAPCKQ